jgi:hypothetical protein
MAQEVHDRPAQIIRLSAGQTSPVLTWISANNGGYLHVRLPRQSPATGRPPVIARERNLPAQETGGELRTAP